MEQQTATDNREKKKRDLAHKQLREMVENAVQFLALFLVLCWISDYTHNPVSRALLRVSAFLCLFPGALLRALCVFANDKMAMQIIKECPVLGHSIYRFLNLYRLAFGVTFMLLLFGGSYICAYVHFQ
jgi:hypothetical protein